MKSPNQSLMNLVSISTTLDQLQEAVVHTNQRRKIRTIARWRSNTKSLNAYDCRRYQDDQELCVIETKPRSPSAAYTTETFAIPFAVKRTLKSASAQILAKPFAVKSN